MEKSCLIFLFKSDGESCLYKKNKKRKRNLNLFYILVANLFTLEHAFFMAKLSYAISNVFITAIALFCPVESEISLPEL